MLTRKNSTTFLLFLLCLLSGKLNFLFAQEVWSLEKCIERGIEKNLGLKGTELGLQNRMVSLREARLQQLPTLNASVNYGLSIGRNIDPTTNAFVTQNILFGNYGISAGLPVYQGGFVQNNIKYNRALTEASARDYEQAVNDLSLNIAGLYLSVLLADERVEISRKNLETVTAQRKNMERLVEIGSRAAADALEINAQEARAEQTLISAQNNAEQARLQLRQQLRLESAAVLVLQRPDDASFRNIENESYTAEQLYQIALGNQPGIQSAERNVMAADIQKNMARAAYFPRISAFGNINSRYSDAAKTPTAFSDRLDSISGNFNGVPVTFEFVNKVPADYKTISFKEQFKQFIGYNFGLGASVPIFNAFNARTSVQRAQIGKSQAELALETRKENLRLQVSQAVANVKAAIKEFDAEKKSYDVTRLVSENTQKKFEIGSANSFELTTSQNNYAAAQNSLVIAKYDLLFKQKILDLYAGKKIR